MSNLPALRSDQIGEDVEFFAIDRRTKEPLPVWKWFPKQEGAITVKRPPDTLRGRGAHFSGNQVKVFRDGLAVELNVAPTQCRAWLWQDVLMGLKGSKPKVPNFTYTTVPYIEFSDEFRSTFPEDLQVLGCNPTLDAYTERSKRVDVDPMKINFRTSGAHLHMSFTGTGWNPASAALPQECWTPIIKLSDLLLGVPFTYIFGDELEFKRRKLYGQAGEFRFQQSYGGIEYRVLSSRLFNHPATFSLFTGIWKYMIPLYPQLWKFWDSAWEDDIRQGINEGVGLEKLLGLWDKMVTSLGRTFTYTLGGPELKPNNLRIWKRRRQTATRKRTAFPDGGIFTRNYAEAHTGWSEYADEWGLSAKH